MKKLKCKNCKKTTLHSLLQSVRFLTKIRTITTRTWMCHVCKEIKVTKNEKKNENTSSFNRLHKLKENGINIEIVYNEKPKELWLITQYYKPKQSNRAREITKCLENNSKLYQSYQNAYLNLAAKIEFFIENKEESK